MTQKRQTLNADKRKVIADVFQNHWEREDNPMKQAHTKAIAFYNDIRTITKKLVEEIVREHQPQEDIDTVRAMSNKYGRSGGELYHDNCFNFQHPITKVDDEGKEYQTTDDINIDFKLSDKYEFAYSYYRDHLKNQNGFDPDFKLKLGHDWSKRNPKFYQDETAINTYLGFQNSSNEDKSIIKLNSEWDNDFKLWVIGTSYCHTRQFKVNETTYKCLEQFNIARDNVIMAHAKLFEYVESKMKKLRLGLKSYKYFDQAKTLADKLGIPLNESILNESSSLALSIYSPENLASLLEDKVEMTRAEKIAYFKAQQQAIN